MWREQNGAPDTAEMFARIKHVVDKEPELERVENRIIRRVRAIMTYALGKCQLPDVRAMLEPLEHFVATHVSEMGDPEQLLLEVVEENATDEEILPMIQQLEDRMHSEKKGGRLQSAKPTFTSIVQKKQEMLNEAA